MRASKTVAELRPEQEALLLLSWARRIDAATGKDTPPGALARQRATQSRAFRTFQARCRARAEEAGRELRLLLQEKEADAARLQQEPENERAQEAYRVATAEIDYYRGEIKRFNDLLNASRPEDLGGFVNLPLEDYAARLGLGGAPSPYGMEDVYTVLIGIAVSVLGILALLYMFVWSKEIRVETLPTDSPIGRVVVRIHNDATRPVEILAPLDAFTSGGGVSQYGIDLYVRERREEEFVLVSPPDEAWTHQGTPTRRQDAVRIGPKLSGELVLSLKALERGFPDLDGYRIVIKKKNGLEIRRFEQSFRV